MREKLIDRMIRIYGFENPIVIEFCSLCEKWEDTNEKDNLLEAIVKSHEEFPDFGDEEEDEDIDDASIAMRESLGNNWW